MSASPTILGILGSALGTLGALWLILHLDRNRHERFRRTAAIDVALLVIGSFAGILAGEALM